MHLRVGQIASLQIGLPVFEHIRLTQEEVLLGSLEKLLVLVHVGKLSHNVSVSEAVHPTDAAKYLGGRQSVIIVLVLIDNRRNLVCLRLVLFMSAYILKTK